MNANFGIVLRNVDRRLVLAPLAPRMRTWGDETVREEGPDRYAYTGLEDVEFEICPVTKFIRSRLPASEQNTDIEYAWMTGAGLDRYQEWVAENGAVANYCSFESEFVRLLSELNFWAVMFAPENDRLGTFAMVSSGEAVEMLRRAVRDVASSDGFLAIGKNVSGAAS